MPIVWVFPASWHPALIELRLLGKIETGYYRSGGRRYVKRFIPDSASLLYGPTYEDYGKWESWDPNGRKLVLTYPHPHGTWEEWDANGVKRVSESYRHGERHGTWRSWYSSGQLEWEFNYREGEKDGPDRIWFEDGSRSVDVLYKDGRLVGTALEWYRNGRLRSRIEHLDGRRHRVWTWREDGTPELVGVLEGGE